MMISHSYLGWEFLSEIPAFKDNQDIKECIKYHHGRELTNSNIEDNSLAYITYVADNISAAGDRRADIIEGEENPSSPGVLFDKTSPLESVFNILNGAKEKYTYPFRMLDKINYPNKEHNIYSSANYSEILIKIKEHLKGIEVEEAYINSILHLLEATTSFIPSSTNTKELMDISLFDHSKTTGAIASCLYYYLGDINYKERILKNEKLFKEENVFLLYSADISGIQKFIYSISGIRALKSLRSRSLYLEILMENIMDQLLYRVGLSRANLIYTGGGHGYILLPNTDFVKEQLKNFDCEIKEWFLQHFDISLYIASGYTQCNSIELSENIGQVYERVGRELSIKKSQRYTSEDIIRLNSTPSHAEERECRECKRTGPVSKEGTCDICQNLIEISSQIIKDDRYFVVEKSSKESYPKASLPLPFDQQLSIKPIGEIRGKDYIRVYSKNQPSMGYDFATNLWVGDYFVVSSEGMGVKTFEEFAQESTGIDRIAILRADVDNLGRAFTQGFKEQKDGKLVENSQRKYETLSRTATLSRQLSMFFKYYINSLLRNKKRNALIVYSGGDDMFIVGSWDEIIDVAGDIKEAFKRYTQNTLTLSAGIGIYHHSFPISRIADEVGELEQAAKLKDDRKNKVTLFRNPKSKADTLDDWVLEWNQLPKIHRAEKVSNENNKTTSAIELKLDTLKNVFYRDAQKGKAFLYKMLELIRDTDRINIARYAYLLKRAQKDNPNLNIAEFYKYIKNPEERRELEIAITLYSYLTRN